MKTTKKSQQNSTKVTASKKIIRLDFAARSEGDDNPPTEPPVDQEKQDILALKKRVLRADDAYRCCKGGKMQSEKVVLDMKDVFQRISDWNKAHRPHQAKLSAKVLAQAMPLPELVPLPPSTITAIPFTPRFDKLDRFLGWDWAVFYAPGEQPDTGKMPLPEGWSEIDDDAVAHAALALDLCAEVIRRSKKDCMKCVQKKTLGQEKHRKRGFFVSRDGTRNKFKIRVPHD